MGASPARLGQPRHRRLQHRLPFPFDRLPPRRRRHVHHLRRRPQALPRRRRPPKADAALSIILNTIVIILCTAILPRRIFRSLYIHIYYDPNSPEGLLCTRIARILLPGQISSSSAESLPPSSSSANPFSSPAVSPLVLRPSASSPAASSSRSHRHLPPSASEH